MTVRSEGQFNTVVYEDYDLYRGQDRRDVILLHPDDLARLGLAAGPAGDGPQRDRLARDILARAFDKIKPGNALMYYPGGQRAGAPRTCDPASRTPAFKNVAGHARADCGRPSLAAADESGFRGVRGEGSSRGQMRAC